MPGRRFAPAADRNKEPILDVLRRVLPPSGVLLEIASGTGQHAVHFAAALPAITLQPTDADPDALASIAIRVKEVALPNLLAPMRLDVTEDPWPAPAVDAIFCANMVHIAPWEAALGLFRGAGTALSSGGLLATYGPYMVDGAHTAPSNEAFDARLRQQDPSWGVRDVGALVEAAAPHALTLEQRIAMPANNFVLVFRKG